jgi:hypothetical protein
MSVFLLIVLVSMKQFQELTENHCEILLKWDKLCEIKSISWEFY